MNRIRGHSFPSVGKKFVKKFVSASSLIQRFINEDILMFQLRIVVIKKGSICENLGRPFNVKSHQTNQIFNSKLIN
jgi:hypothetical protein